MANDHWIYGRDFKGQFTSPEKESDFLDRRAKWARSIDEALGVGHRGADLFRAVHGYDPRAVGIGDESAPRSRDVGKAIPASKVSIVGMGRATAAVVDEAPVPEEWEVDADPVNYDEGWED